MKTDSRGTWFMWERSRILVVDDEPMNIELLKAILPAKDYEVVTASNGEQALAAVKEQRMDLILLDVMMPQMNGFEVTRSLRAHEATKGVPIILITALSGTS